MLPKTWFDLAPETRFEVFLNVFDESYEIFHNPRDRRFKRDLEHERSNKIPPIFLVSKNFAERSELNRALVRRSTIVIYRGYDIHRLAKRVPTDESLWIRQLHLKTERDYEYHAKHSGYTDSFRPLSAIERIFSTHFPNLQTVRIIVMPGKHNLSVVKRVDGRLRFRSWTYGKVKDLVLSCCTHRHTGREGLVEPWMRRLYEYLDLANSTLEIELPVITVYHQRCEFSGEAEQEEVSMSLTL